MILFKQIVFHARVAPQDPAVAYSGGVASYGTLLAHVEAAVEALQTLDLPSGAMVMLDIHNPLHHVALIIALGLLGRPSASAPSADAIARSGVKPVLMLRDHDNPPPDGVAIRQIDERWFASDPQRQPDYQRLLALPGFASDDDVVRYVYSSGTTGIPKCIAVTGRVIERRALHNLMTVGRGTGNAALNMLGFSTIAGIMAPMTALPLGVMLCFPSGPAEALNMIRLFNVSVLAIAVAQLNAVLAILGDAPPPPSLRRVFVTGSRLPLRLLHEAQRRLSSHVSVIYGSTEMGNMTGVDGPVLERFEGTVGYVRPWVDLQAVDAEGNLVPPGTDGILRVRSPEAAFYVDDGGDRLEMFADGWFYPGDVGRIHADGLVTITGRTNEVINRGGVIVAPEVIEDVLLRDPSVKEAGVVGVSVRDGMDEIWAAVVATDDFDAQAIADRARTTLNEKLPTRILRVDALPRAQSGKLQRGELRRQLIERLQG